jgi:hypothetical protein
MESGVRDMNLPTTPDRPGDRLDALLRAHAPEPLPDDGFTLRTMEAIRRNDPAGSRRRAGEPGGRSRLSATDSARTLALEQRRYARQARLWRWAGGGVCTGVASLVLAMMVGAGNTTPAAELAPAHWLALWLPLAAGAVWYAWDQVRAE